VTERIFSLVIYTFRLRLGKYYSNPVEIGITSVHKSAELLR
jgi:hypothetical protein